MIGYTGKYINLSLYAYYTPDNLIKNKIKLGLNACTTDKVKG